CGLQVGVGLVERVAPPVAIEVGGFRTAMLADRRIPRRRLVDVVAQVDDEVEIVALEVVIGRVVAVLPVLAGGEGEAEPRGNGGRVGRGAGTTDGRDLRAGAEAVPVGSPRLEP